MKLAQDTATAPGTALTAGESNDIMRASLLDVANTLGPNDPLRATSTTTSPSSATSTATCTPTSPPTPPKRRKPSAT